jgi:hypothetical protein
MGTAVIDIPKGMCAPSEIGTLGAFFQPSVTSEEKLVRSDERLIGQLIDVLDRQLITAIDVRSIAEFRANRDKVFPRYVRGLRALHDTASNLISDDIMEFISDSVMPELAGDLEKQRESRFGDQLTDQAVFTLWTVQKIRSLGHDIVDAGDVPSDKKEADNALLNEYRFNSLWSQFHLDVLFTAIRLDRPICEAIRETFCDGLRASVDAYVIMKDALALRRPPVHDDGYQDSSLPWDEEDEQLLASSMRDMDANCSDSH